MRLFLLSSLFGFSSAFSSLKPLRNGRTVKVSTALSYSPEEKAKMNELERWFVPSSNAESLLYDPERTLVTSASRRSRELEISLLETLKESDDAIDELVHLWAFEQSPEVGKQLEGMQSGACSPGLVQEMRVLDSLCQQYPAWAEPWSRIACVHYVRGQYSRSFYACQEALRRKPWHPEVYQLLTRLCLKQRHVPQAIYWARQGLPVRKTSKRRTRWVEGAVKDARERLDLDEAYSERITLANRVQSQEVVQGILHSDCQVEDNETSNSHKSPWEMNNYYDENDDDECELSWE